jgi:hypothetical protein
VTLWANKGTHQLPLKQVHDDTIVPLLVTLPALLAELGQLALSPSSLPIRFLDIWLLDDPIQILVKSIQEESDELLSVVLTVASKGRREAGCYRFKPARGVGRVGRCGPEILDHIAERSGYFSVHA